MTAPFPDSEPLTPEAWHAVRERIALWHPPLAELSFFSLHCWRGGERTRVSALGPHLLVELGDLAGTVMVVCADRCEVRHR